MVVIDLGVLAPLVLLCSAVTGCLVVLKRSNAQIFIGARQCFLLGSFCLCKQNRLQLCVFLDLMNQLKMILSAILIVLLMCCTRIKVALCGTLVVGGVFLSFGADFRLFGRSGSPKAGASDRILVFLLGLGFTWGPL